MKAIKSNPMYFYLMILTICATSGLYVWRALFDNFSVHILALDGQHIGIIQSVREIPGFLSLLVVYALLIIKEHRLSAVSVLICGIGISCTGLFPSFTGIIFTTLIMSFGFHYFETTNQSLTLQHFDKHHAPLVFGSLRSVAAGSCVAASVLIFLLSNFLNFNQLYMLFGGIIVLVSLWALGQNPIDRATVPQHKHMVVKKRYWLYYCLTFMSGARRQIFVAFAVFLMVKKFDYNVQEIALLFLLNNVVNYFLSPLIGKGINRFGERSVLSLEYGALILVFIGYAMVESKLIAAFLYIADHIFFNFSIAIRTFFQKIAEPEDIAPSMAVGFTINHIAAVILPVIGGLLWLVDYRVVFLSAAIFSLVSLLLVQLISGQLKKHAAKIP
ncbi:MULTISPECIES: MFS transporter [Desulfosediminicola]|uniref:MFS transporter n=1 Tax=Desulfosediminicola TaxID=2886823 RepID=UPI0010ACA5A9|nr:MFS transporter [Desulfosediminicola ganghwensis]